MGRLGLLLLGLFWANTAVAQCRQALALGLDVSGSVDAAEYQLQIAGLANALNNAEVRNALLAMPSAPVVLAVYEWSGPEDQRLLLDWTRITSGEVLDRAIAQIGGTGRATASPGTALGTAIRFGTVLVRRQNECWKRTLDISGDGKSNMGPHPRETSELARLSGLTINALVVGADAPKISDARQVEIAELSSYFRAYVITGADSFVQTALGFEAYEDAMTRKLLRELQGLALSSR